MLTIMKMGANMASHVNEIKFCSPQKQGRMLAIPWWYHRGTLNSVTNSRTAFTYLLKYPDSFWGCPKPFNSASKPLQEHEPPVEMPIFGSS